MAGADSNADPPDPTKKISSDEFIIRRLPRDSPNWSTTIDRPNVGLTATSSALKPRKKEGFPSWSRIAITTPEKLLRLAENQDLDVSGWRVAQVKVEDVRSLGLDVVADPTPDDPGHCVIKPTEHQDFTNRVWSRLAKQALVVPTREEE